MSYVIKSGGRQGKSLADLAQEGDWDFLDLIVESIRQWPDHVRAEAHDLVARHKEEVEDARDVADREREAAQWSAKLAAEQPAFEAAIRPLLMRAAGNDNQLNAAVEKWRKLRARRSAEAAAAAIVEPLKEYLEQEGLLW